MKNNFQHYSNTCFVAVAHADDWQLFMHPNIHGALLDSNTRIIFIITTAGDAGMSEQFWRAREDGHKSSIRFCLAPHGKLYESSGIQKVHGHTVHYWSLNNTTTYFLRLPDGGLNGKGFAAHQYQSLQKLRLKEIPGITAADNSARFSSWAALVHTIAAITAFERRDMPQAAMHFLNPDTIANPGDHPDHTATGHIMQTVAIQQGMEQWLYTGYSSSKAATLPPSSLFWKAGMMAAYEKAVFDGSGYSTLQENPGLYCSWCAATAGVTKLQPFNTLQPAGE